MDVDDYGPLLTAKAFFEIDFGERIKAELEAGVIHPLVRGPMGSVITATNLVALLLGGAREAGFFACGSRSAVTTNRIPVRYPDVSVFGPTCRGPAFDQCVTFDDPVVIAHGMPTVDRRWRSLAEEYMIIPSTRALVLVDWQTQRLAVAQRIGDTAWQFDHDWKGDIEVPVLSLTLPRADILAVD